MNERQLAYRKSVRQWWQAERERRIKWRREYDRRCGRTASGKLIRK